jgi:hypothetical protein
MKTQLYDFDDALRDNLYIPIGGWMAHMTDGITNCIMVWDREPTDDELDEFLRGFK